MCCQLLHTAHALSVTAHSTCLVSYCTRLVSYCTQHIPCQLLAYTAEAFLQEQCMLQLNMHSTHSTCCQLLAYMAAPFLQEPCMLQLSMDSTHSTCCQLLAYMAAAFLQEPCMLQLNMHSTHTAHALSVTGVHSCSILTRTMHATTKHALHTHSTCCQLLAYTAVAFLQEPCMLQLNMHSTHTAHALSVTGVHSCSILTRTMHATTKHALHTHSTCVASYWRTQL